MFLFFVYPGAFVDMQIPEFNYLSVASGLRIVCAGVWHNFVLSVAAYVFLQTFLGSAVIFPLYERVDGVVVTQVHGVWI